MTGSMMKKEKINLICEYLDTLFSDPKCELNYSKDYELLIAVMLSAQTTDKRVNEVTKILFDKKEEIQLALPVDISLDERTAVEGISIPFHKGAAEYYKECGIDVKTEKGNN